LDLHTIPNSPIEKSGFEIQNLQVSKDLRRALVIYTCESKSKELSKFLTSYAPILRYKITPRLGMKFSPEFRFCNLSEYKNPTIASPIKKELTQEQILEKETRRIKFMEKQKKGV